MCEWDQAAQCDKHRLRRFLFMNYTDLGTLDLESYGML